MTRLKAFRKAEAFDFAAFERNAVQAANMLRALGNERRLMILCKLVEWGEANVSTLAEAVGLSQSALSQHLARMREEDIVAFRRDSQTIWYRIDDPRTEQLLATLHRLFCRPLPKSKKGTSR
jgi:ArsR family transcriptional regulator, virulence genes transcriptional regulator